MLVELALTLEGEEAIASALYSQAEYILSAHGISEDIDESVAYCCRSLKPVFNRPLIIIPYSCWIPHCL